MTAPRRDARLLRTAGLANRAFYSVPNRGTARPCTSPASSPASGATSTTASTSCAATTSAGESEVQAFAWDQQTNTRSPARSSSRTQRMKGGKRQKLTDLGDIYLSTRTSAPARSASASSRCCRKRGQWTRRTSPTWAWCTGRSSRARRPSTTSSPARLDGPGRPSGLRQVADTPSPDFHRSPHRACFGENPELFFPASVISIEVQMAKSICGSCPFVRDCLLWALPIGNLAGIWGGTTEDERAQLRKRPAARALVKALAGQPAGRPDPTPEQPDSGELALNRSRIETLRCIQLGLVRLHSDGRAMGTFFQTHGQYNNRRCFRVSDLEAHGLVEVDSGRMYRLTNRGAARLAEHLTRSAA
jgi:WhiB family redox-sensing transcriptional regulator